MKRSLIILLLVIVFAGWLGTLIARDPGYVLISYQDYSMQTSLWVMMGILLGFSLVLYVTLRLINIIRRSPLMYRGWRHDQQQDRASNLTIKGLTLLAEGEFDRARRCLPERTP